MWIVAVVACGGAAADAGRGGESGIGAAADGPRSDSGVADGDSSGDGTGSGCGPGLSDCDGTCADLLNDRDHCGVCGKPCAPGLACVDGTCNTCVDLDLCDGACVDISVDPKHCGGCDKPCDADMTCVEGACSACFADMTLCDTACVDTTNDELHCGVCGNVCGDGPCVYGECAGADVHHVLITGQSLSVGAMNVVVSTDQPYDNVSFNTGVRAGAINLAAFIPLVETQDANLGETVASGMANLATELSGVSGYRGHRTLASANGVGGVPYSGLRKGTLPYGRGLAQINAGLSVARESGLSYRMRAVAVIHGESDHLGFNRTYDDDLLEWQSDYEADVHEITGQTGPVPMFLCQMSSHTAYDSPTSPIPTLQLEASRRRPDRVFLVGPKYFLTYSDGVHITGDSTRWLGEYYAKAYRRVLIEGQPWFPVSPREVSREGAEIRITFHVPEPPLVLDEQRVSNPGNFGFEYTDNSLVPPTIANVALEGEDTVVVTLSATPNGMNKRIRYAYSGFPGQPGGPLTGARGNLRDSDATSSRFGYDLSNWAVHFDEPVR